MKTETKLLAGVAGAFVALLFTIIAVLTALVVTNSQPQSQLVETNNNVTNSTDYQALEYAWNSVTASDRANACEYFNRNPELVYKEFNSDAAISREVFFAFFESKC